MKEVENDLVSVGESIRCFMPNDTSYARVFRDTCQLFRYTCRLGVLKRVMLIERAMHGAFLGDKSHVTKISI
jgi:hypothetical protein